MPTATPTKAEATTQVAAQVEALVTTALHLLDGLECTTARTRLGNRLLEARKEARGWQGQDLDGGWDVT